MYSYEEPNRCGHVKCAWYFDLLVIVHSASSAGEINKLPGMSNHEMLVIFAINVAICTIFLMAYSAYFVVAIRSATNVLEERNDELDFMVHYDALTNMRNRQNMDEIFEEYECYEKITVWCRWIWIISNRQTVRTVIPAEMSF